MDNITCPVCGKALNFASDFIEVQRIGFSDDHKENELLCNECLDWWCGVVTPIEDEVKRNHVPLFPMIYPVKYWFRNW